MTELAALLANSGLWPVQPGVMIATISGVSISDNDMHLHVIGECNRNTPLKILRVFARSCVVVWQERPDIVVTTGSLPLAIFCLAARLAGARIVWIDSISQIDDISMSGKLIKPFTSRFFVQWPELAVRFKNTTYAGELV